jgi:hypothetical protein
LQLSEESILTETPNWTSKSSLNSWNL